MDICDMYIKAYNDMMIGYMYGNNVKKDNVYGKCLMCVCDLNMWYVRIYIYEMRMEKCTC